MQCEDDQGACLSGSQITISEKNKRARIKLANKIHEKYENVTIKNPSGWTLGALNDVFYGLNQVNGYHGFDGNKDAMYTAFGHVTFVQTSYPDNKAGGAMWSTGIIRLDVLSASSSTVIHEMGHVLDGGLSRRNNRVPVYSERYGNVFDAGAGATDYARNKQSSVEDFADSFLAVIKYGPTAYQHVNDPRINVITGLMHSYTHFDNTITPGR
jgi:hypothetical protein